MSFSQSTPGLNLTGIDPTQQAISTVTTQVVTNESLTIASIIGLQTQLDQKEYVSDLTSNYYTSTTIDGKLATINTNITGLTTLDSTMSGNLSLLSGTVSNNFNTLTGEINSVSGIVATNTSKITSNTSLMSSLSGIVSTLIVPLQAKSTQYPG